MARRTNGEGTIYKRKDGRYEAALAVPTVSGTVKRIRLYGKTRAEAHAKLVRAKANADQGIPAADKTWRLGDYLDYWLKDVVRHTRRPSTFERYESAVRLHLKPGIGNIPLSKLTVPLVQGFFNQKLAAGFKIRNVQIMREVLSAALTRAVREELLLRNVARLAELPTWERPESKHWTAAEAKRFLEAASSDPLFPAFVLLLLYGLRRGEVLGLRWTDVNLETSVLRIRRQVQRVGKALIIGPVKTRAGKRKLPLVSLVQQALVVHKQRTNSHELVFETRNGNPIEPRNLVRSFHRIREAAGLRRIRVHDTRHTAATLLKVLGVPDRDIQLILGHSTVTLTQEIYEHDDMDSRTDAFERVEQLVLRDADSARCRQNYRQGRSLLSSLHSFNLAGVAGLEPTTPGFGDPTSSSIHDRITEVDRAVRERRRQWVVGIVAVKIAVKIPSLAVASNTVQVDTSSVVAVTGGSDV